MQNSVTATIIGTFVSRVIFARLDLSSHYYGRNQRGQPALFGQSFALRQRTRMNFKFVFNPAPLKEHFEVGLSLRPTVLVFA